MIALTVDQAYSSLSMMLTGNWKDLSSTSYRKMTPCFSSPRCMGADRLIHVVFEPLFSLETQIGFSLALRSSLLVLYQPAIVAQRQAPKVSVPSLASV